jgi:hypothetical protein
VWGQHRHHCLAKRIKEAFEVTYETTRTRIDNNQDSRSALGQSNGHASRLKSQRQTRDERGNACVQHGVTSQ